MPDTTPIDLSNTCLRKGCLDGEVAVITGSTSNVGLGYARALAWAGAQVVITGRNDERGQAAEAQINAESGPDMAMYVHCDVTKDDEVKALANAAFERFGKVDILINNAHVLAINGKVLESPVSDLDMSYMIAAHGSMLTIKEFVPGMVERGHGTVAYSTTQLNYQPPLIGGSMYTAGKAAATSLHLSLATEVAGTGVNVFCLAPTGVGIFTPESVAHLDVDPTMPPPTMAGFPGLIPPDAGGAAMVHSILNGAKLHGSAFGVSDALLDMGYPFPVPETAVPMGIPRINDPIEITLLWLLLGKGFEE